MNVVALRTLVRFWEKHPRSKQPLEDWYHEALHARWATPEEVKRHYPGASRGCTINRVNDLRYPKEGERRWMRYGTSCWTSC